MQGYHSYQVGRSEAYRCAELSVILLYLRNYQPRLSRTTGSAVPTSLQLGRYLWCTRIYKGLIRHSPDYCDAYRLECAKLRAVGAIFDTLRDLR